MIQKLLTPLLVTFSAVVLTACGGGGGGGGSASTTSAPVISANSFNFLSGYQRSTAAAANENYTISGTCNGTSTQTRTAASNSTTFESRPALSSVSVSTRQLTNCTPASSADTETNFYNPSTYAPFGSSIVGGDYGVYGATNIPVTVRVGDAGVIGTETLYTNSAKSSISGRNDISFVIEPDTATTAIANIIVKVYDFTFGSYSLTSTQQIRYRMAADGTLTAISIDVQFANGNRLIYTRTN
jgi:hypothetical protein